MQKTYQKVLYWTTIIVLWSLFGYYCFLTKMSLEVGLAFIPMLSISLILQIVCFMKGIGNKEKQKEFTKYRMINGLFFLICYSMVLFFVLK